MVNHLWIWKPASCSYPELSQWVRNDECHWIRSIRYWRALRWFNPNRIIRESYCRKSGSYDGFIAIDHSLWWTDGARPFLSCYAKGWSLHCDNILPNPGLIIDSKLRVCTVLVLILIQKLTHTKKDAHMLYQLHMIRAAGCVYAANTEMHTYCCVHTSVARKLSLKRHLRFSREWSNEKFLKFANNFLI